MRTKLLAAMLFMALGATAEELRVADVTIPQNGTATIEIELINPSIVLESFTFQIELPDGIVPVMGADGYPSIILGNRFSGGMFSGYKSGNIAAFARLTDGTPITGTEGVLFSTMIQVDGDVAVGTVLTATVSDITFTTLELTKEKLNPVTFNITIGEPDDGRIHFNETSLTMPVYTAGSKGDVTMTRTIKANQWSTIVLPFTLTKAKAEAAFGSDVQLAEFSGFTVDYGDDEENVTPLNIVVNFSTYTMTAKKSMTGGKPFLIKTSSEITSFEADDVTMAGSVTDVQKTDEYDTAGKFTGSFVKTKVPADGLFISDNKFWYSTGATNIKAFRGWFELGAVLDKETDFGAKVFFSIDDEPTSVDGVSVVPTRRGDIYSIEGQYVGRDIPTERLKKGIYIVNGKKVVVK